MASTATNKQPLLIDRPFHEGVIVNGSSASTSLDLGAAGVWAPHQHGAPDQHQDGVNTDLETKDWLRDKSLKFGDGPRHYQVPGSVLNTSLLMRNATRFCC